MSSNFLDRQAMESKQRRSIIHSGLERSGIFGEMCNFCILFASSVGGDRGLRGCVCVMLMQMVT